MKKTSLLLFASCVAYKVASQTVEVLDCDETVIDFGEGFAAATPVESSSVEVIDGETLFDGVINFIGCNHTHFGVITDGVTEIYETSIFRFDDPDPADVCEDGNCYFSFCQALDSSDSEDDDTTHDHGARLLLEQIRELQHDDNSTDHHEGNTTDHGDDHQDNSTDYDHGNSTDHDDHDHGNSTDHDDHDHGNSTDHDDHDHGNSTDHDDHDHGNSTDHDDHDHGNSTDHGVDEFGFLDGYVITVGHTPKCCSDFDVETDFAHHTCDLDTVFTADCSDVVASADEVLRATEYDAIIHPPEHTVDGFPDDHGTSTQHASSETIYFLGCNDTYVDFFADRHIYTFALANLYKASDSCGEDEHDSDDHDDSHNHTARFLQHSEHTNETTGECLIAQCILEGSDESEHDHGFRMLQHDHDDDEDEDHDHDDTSSELDLDGIDLEAHAEFYLDGYTLSTSIVDMCCSSYSAHDHDHDASALFSSVCATEETFPALSAADATDGEDSDETEAVDDELYLLFFGGGLFGVIALVLAVAMFASKGEKKDKKGLSTMDVKEDEVEEEVTKDEI